MREVFVDTAAWVAIKDGSDSLHHLALALNRKLLGEGNRLVTSNFVLDETYTLLLSRVSHSAAVQFGEEIRASRLLRVVHVSEELEQAAWQLFKQFSDKKFSFTDCASFAIMQQNDILEAFTSDHHFEQAGFQKLLQGKL